MLILAEVQESFKIYRISRLRRRSSSCVVIRQHLQATFHRKYSAHFPMENPSNEWN